MPEHGRGLARHDCDQRGASRTCKCLEADDHGRIEIGERSSQHVVECPGGDCANHGNGAPHRMRSRRVRGKHQQEATGEHHRRRESDAPSDVLAVEQHRESERQDGLEVQQQGAGGAARPLEAPGEKCGSEYRTEERDDEESRHVHAPQLWLASSPCKPRASDGRASVEQSGGRERAESRAESLDDRDGDTEKKRCPEGEPHPLRHGPPGHLRNIALARYYVA